MYSSNMPLTSELNRGGGGLSVQSHSPADLPPEMSQYPLNRRLGWPQSRFALVPEKSPPPGFDPQIVQPVASRYTNYAIPRT
jgi:hypothetical protein